MTIIHETRYRKEDGTEVDIIPLKDMVVTAPGYFNFGGDWRRDRDLRGNQGKQLYEAFEELCPDESDHWETIDWNISEGGGRAKFRTYIEKSKLPQFKDKIKQSMVFGKPRDILFKDRKLMEGKYFSENDRKLLDIEGHLIKNGKCPINRAPHQRAYFYMSENSEETYGFGFQLWDNNAMIYSVYKDPVNDLLERLKKEDVGLEDSIRAEFFEELIKNNK